MEYSITMFINVDITSVKYMYVWFTVITSTICTGIYDNIECADHFNSYTLTLTHPH